VFLSKGSMIPLRRDDVVCQDSAGGGGFGDPLKRDPQQVLADVRLGYVSRAAAQREYGVVITDEGTMDEAATSQLRRH
jgi:N-methylhydantoinase B